MSEWLLLSLFGKKRDNPERGRKVRMSIRRCDADRIVKKEITPRGDGKGASAYIFRNWDLVIVKKEITPRGDGKTPSEVYLSEYSLLVKKEITPRGDGKSAVIVLFNMIHTRKKRDNPERGRKHCGSEHTYLFDEES